jgi:hypothetical protein
MRQRRGPTSEQDKSGVLDAATRNLAHDSGACGVAPTNPWQTCRVAAVVPTDPRGAA